MRNENFNRRQFLKMLAGSGAALVPAALMGSQTVAGNWDQNELPNIVLIVSDDQGYGDSSCYFHAKEVDTPNIDRLAASGVRLTNGYASGCVCAPTRAGLLTGRYQQRFGFYTAPHSRIGLPLSEITLADLLKKAGYATGIFGKWHLGIKPEYHPLERGFDQFYGFLGHGAHDYFDLTPKPGNEHNAIYRNRKIIADTGYLTDNLAREAVSFIRANRDKPYFCYLPFNAVHAPLQALEEDIRLFNTDDPSRNIYLAMLKKMDEAVGKVLDAVKESGKAENTLIVFFSDNGGAKAVHAYNGKLRDYKQSLYEGGIRVPFIVSWPKMLPKNKTSDEPAICLDVVPTVCAAAGIELPGDRIYDGKNLLPVLSGKETGPIHDMLFWNDGRGQWAVRQGKWKLVKNRRGQVELYDLENDIGETTDLAGTHPDIYRRLQKAYEGWIAQMGVPLDQISKK